jgi:polysaccharide export outer membrane protein
MKIKTVALLLSATALVAPATALAQSDRAASAVAASATSAVPGAVNTPANYVIGPDDVLSIMFWRDKDMSTDVVVRPDGQISLPLVNEIHAGGLTPGQLRDAIDSVARRYVEEPSITVVVKQINSRKIFITGQVEKPGPYTMSGRTTVLQLISMAGGLREFADGKKILIMRTDKNGKQSGFLFNYRQVTEGKNLAQNIELQPGDTVVVP